MDKAARIKHLLKLIWQESSIYSLVASVVTIVAGWFTSNLAVTLGIDKLVTITDRDEVAITLIITLCWVLWFLVKLILHLESKIESSIRLSCDNRDDCVLFTPAVLVDREGNTIAESSSYYVRVRIENEGVERLNGLAAHLTNVQLRKEGGSFEDTKYSYDLTFVLGKVPLPKGAKQYVNVFYINQHHKRIEFESELNVHKGICDGHGYYKFTIQVSAENSAPKTISIGFDWKGVYERPKVDLLEN